MNKTNSKKKLIWVLLSGILGCILMGGSDWLMIYGDTAYKGSLSWLTVGVAEIGPERNALALLFAFPAVIFYSIALFGIKKFIEDERQKKIYSGLTAVGLTPWLCIHLLYVMIFYTFAWLTKEGHEALAYETGEAMFGQFAWVIPVGEVIMLLPFIYWFIVVVTNKTVFPRLMALNNPLIIYVILKVFTSILPDQPFRLAFVNGLMSESMVIWFVSFIIFVMSAKQEEYW